MDGDARPSDRGVGGASRPCAHRFFSRKTLVVVQAALSLVLLAVSGLLTAAAQAGSSGFRFAQDRRLVAHMDPRSAATVGTTHAAVHSHSGFDREDSRRRIGRALSMYSPLNGNNWEASVWVDGQPPPAPRKPSRPWIARRPDTLTQSGIRFCGPRDHGADTADSLHVAVVNEAFARRFFGNQDPVGKHFGRLESQSSRLYEVVGVAKDARYMTFNLDKPVSPMFFLPGVQHDVPNNDPGSHYLQDIVIVTRPGVNLPVAQLTQAMASVDPNLPLIWIRPLSEQVANLFRQQRLIARLTSFFGFSRSCWRASECTGSLPSMPGRA